MGITDANDRIMARANALYLHQAAWNNQNVIRIPSKCDAVMPALQLFSSSKHFDLLTFMVCTHVHVDMCMLHVQNPCRADEMMDCPSTADQMNKCKWHHL